MQSFSPQFRYMRIKLILKNRVFFSKKLRQLLLNAVCVGTLGYILNCAKRNRQPGVRVHAET